MIVVNRLSGKVCHFEALLFVVEMRENFFVPIVFHVEADFEWILHWMVQYLLLPPPPGGAFE